MTKTEQKLPDNFTIDIGDATEYEDLIAEIGYKGKFVALITQELGLEHACIEWPAEFIVRSKGCDLREFLKAVEIALAELHRFRKTK